MVENEKTSIAVSKNTKSRLEQYKILKEEPYNSVINRVLDELEKIRKEIGTARGSNQKLTI